MVVWVALIAAVLPLLTIGRIPALVVWIALTVPVLTVLSLLSVWGISALVIRISLIAAVLPLLSVRRIAAAVASGPEIPFRLLLFIGGIAVVIVSGILTILSNGFSLTVPYFYINRIGAVGVNFLHLHVRNDLTDMIFFRFGLGVIGGIVVIKRAYIFFVREPVPAGKTFAVL